MPTTRWPELVTMDTIRWSSPPAVVNVGSSRSPTEELNPYEGPLAAPIVTPRGHSMNVAPPVSVGSTHAAAAVTASVAALVSAPSA